MIDYQVIESAFIEFTKTDLFHNFALLFIFLIAGSPSFQPLPNEVFVIPAYVSGLSPLLIVTAVGFGGFIGDSALYFLGHHIHKKIKGTTKSRVNHWLYKYKHFVYLASPTMFFGIGDVVMILSGIRHISFRGIVPFLILGNFLRGIWGMILVIYGIELFDWLL